VLSSMRVKEWGRCHCALATNYPFTFDPRPGVAYQLNSRPCCASGPVFRATRRRMTTLVFRRISVHSTRRKITFPNFDQIINQGAEPEG
jgi:hypothetical protein